MERAERLRITANLGPVDREAADEWLAWWDSDRAEAEATYNALTNAAQNRVAFALAGARLRAKKA